MQTTADLFDVYTFMAAPTRPAVPIPKRTETSSFCGGRIVKVVNRAVGTGEPIAASSDGCRHFLTTPPTRKV